MPNGSGVDVVATPFLHVVKPTASFAALKADFPSREVFEAQLAGNGLVGSRTGSGFDNDRGDPQFAALTARSPARAELAG